MLQTFALCISMLSMAAAWLMPNHYPPWTSFHGELMAFAALAALYSAVVFGRPREEKPIAPWKLVGVLGGVAMLVLVQAALGQIYTGEAAVGLLYLVGALLAVQGGSTLRTAGHRRIALVCYAWCVVLAVIVSIYLALLQKLQLEEMLGVFAANLRPGERPFANLAQANHFSTLLVIGLVATAYLHATSALSKATLTVVGMFITLGVALGESRTAYLSVAVLGGYLMIVGEGKSGVGRTTIGVAWLLVALWTVFWQMLGDARSLEGIHQDGARLTLWTQALSAISQEPLTGYGFHQSQVAQKVASLWHPSSMPTDFFHNVILDIVVWFGIPLGMVAMGLIAVYFFRLVCKSENPDQVIGLSMVIPVAIHSLLEFPFAYAYFLFPAMWLLGLTHSSAVGRELQMSRRGLYAVFFVWLVLCGLALRDYLVVEEQYRTMRFEIRGIGARNQTENGQNLIVLNQIGEIFWAVKVDPHLPLSDIELKRFARITSNTTWASLQTRYAAALFNNGKIAESTRQMESIRSVYGERAHEDARKILESLKNPGRPSN